MANQLKMAAIDAILTLYAQGWSQRAIARRLGVHRETVSRHVRLASGVSKPAILHAGPVLDGEVSSAADIDFSKPAKMHAGELLPPESAAALPLPRRSYCDRFCETEWMRSSPVGHRRTVRPGILPTIWARSTTSPTTRVT
jgi:hypothetical protein